MEALLRHYFGAILFLSLLVPAAVAAQEARVSKVAKGEFTVALKPLESVSDVGGGIKVAAVVDPFGNRFGIIENPHFDVSAVR